MCSVLLSLDVLLYIAHFIVALLGHGFSVVWPLLGGLFDRTLLPSDHLPGLPANSASCGLCGTHAISPTCGVTSFVGGFKDLLTYDL